MSTTFARGVHKVTKEETGLYDIESSASMLDLFRQMQEVSRERQEETAGLKQWKLGLYNYRGERIGDFKWKKQVVEVTLNDLFG